MTRSRPDPTTAAWNRCRHRRLLAAEEGLREAGRTLQLVGVSDIEADRMAKIVFRLASRIRSDRLAVAA